MSERVLYGGGPLLRKRVRGLALCDFVRVFLLLPLGYRAARAARTELTREASRSDDSQVAWPRAQADGHGQFGLHVGGGTHQMGPSARRPLAAPRKAPPR
jgi:hypothetical protein